uniref:Uncharacterized protein n=1 Tax=Arundo donax TaxID=35708 RepID=A0A0A9GY71_ARUDO
MYNGQLFFYGQDKDKIPYMNKLYTCRVENKLHTSTISNYFLWSGQAQNPKH